MSSSRTPGDGQDACAGGRVGADLVVAHAARVRVDSGDPSADRHRGEDLCAVEGDLVRPVGRVTGADMDGLHDAVPGRVDAHHRLLVLQRDPQRAAVGHDTVGRASHRDGGGESHRRGVHPQDLVLPVRRHPDRAGEDGEGRGVFRIAGGVPVSEDEAAGDAVGRRVDALQRRLFLAFVPRWIVEGKDVSVETNGIAHATRRHGDDGRRHRRGGRRADSQHRPENAAASATAWKRVRIATSPARSRPGGRAMPPWEGSVAARLKQLSRVGDTPDRRHTAATARGSGRRRRARRPSAPGRRARRGT